MKAQRRLFSVLVAALCLALAIPWVEAESQRVPVYIEIPDQYPRSPLLAPGGSAETQNVPVPTDPLPSPPSGRQRYTIAPDGTLQPVTGPRRSLLAPGGSAETRNVPVQGVQPTASPPGRVRRPLTISSQDAAAETQRVRTGGPPQAAETRGGEPGFTESHGAAVITALLTAEQIIRCTNDGLSAGECAYRLLEQAAVGTGITVAAMVTGTVPVLIAVGAGTMTVKGFQDSVEILYETGSLAQALIGERQIERGRERQQEINRPRLREMLDLERTKTLALLDGHAGPLDQICLSLEGIAGDAEKNAKLARDELAAMPGSGLAAEIVEIARRCGDAAASSARVESIRDRVTGYASQIRDALDRLNAQARSCTTEEEARRIREGYDACAGLMAGIRQLNDEARRTGAEIKRIRNNAPQIRSLVDAALTSKERISVFAGHAVGRAEVFDAGLQRAIDGNSGLLGACAASDRNIDNLRQAFGELDPEETAVFKELKDLVETYRGRLCGHEPLKTLYDNAGYMAVDAKLSSENLARSLEGPAAALGDCGSASVDELLTDIAAAEQEVALAVAAHGDLPAMAGECANRSTAEIGPGPGEADDGFADEGTLIGDAPIRPTIQSGTATEPWSTAAEPAAIPGSPDIPGEDDGFAEMGTSVGSSPAGTEVVVEPLRDGDSGFADAGTVIQTHGLNLLDTFSPFAPAGPVASPDRAWVPRSWRTGGNAAATRAEIYQAASRIGWAVALAEHIGPSSDPLISEHLLAASGHMERANAASFAPHKAWPDWSRRRSNYERWIRQLTSGTQISREYFRKGLASTLKSEAGQLKRQLATLATAQAGTLQNCDTYTFEIGYRLAFASQLQSIAIDGLGAGLGEDWARKLRNQASSSVSSANSAIHEIKSGPGRAGCENYAPLQKDLARVQTRVSSSPEPELHGVWVDGLAVASGGSAPSPGTDDFAGEWVITWIRWRDYLNRHAESLVDPYASSNVRVRIEPRGGGYVGIITRQGPVPLVSDPFTYETTGRKRLHLFHVGLEYLHLKKTAENLYEGTISGVGGPGHCHIVVYNEAAKFFQGRPAASGEVLRRENESGALMLRLDAAGNFRGPNMEAVGRHVFAGMESEVPAGGVMFTRGSELTGFRGVLGPAYGFRYKKPFQFQPTVDNNPGLGATVHYLGTARLLNTRTADIPGPDPNLRKQEKTFERHGGKGYYRLDRRSSSNPIDITISSVLLWFRGEWGVSIGGLDYPNHPGTQFGGEQGQLNHMIRLLDRLIQRLQTIPQSALAPGGASSSSAQGG